MPRSRRSRRGNRQVPRPSRRGGSSYPRQSTQGLVASQPNEYNPHSRIRRRFRFVAVGALNSTISGSCLLNLLHHATAAAVSYSAFQAVRLLHVEVWGAPVTGPTYSEITFKWLAHRSEPMVFDDRGTVQCPGHIKQRPPPQSDAARWVSFTDTAAEQQSSFFNVIGAAGTVVDIGLEFQLKDDNSTAPHALTVAAAVAGSLYFNYLDNTAVGGAGAGNTNLIPDGNVLPLAAFG